MELTLMEGNEAIAWGAVAAGCNFFDSDFVAMNRGADFVKYLVLSLRAKTRCLIGARRRSAPRLFYKSVVNSLVTVLLRMAA